MPSDARKRKAKKPCERCEGTGYVCRSCGSSVRIEGQIASQCSCPYNGGRQPPVSECECVRELLPRTRGRGKKC